MQQVHLRINDAATGKPTPVRLRITDADGTYYAPFGRLTEFATGVNQDVGGNVMIGTKKWAYIDGACEIPLPPGRLRIEITKGPEYTPIDEEITLLAGKMSLRFTIERWCDMRKLGWYSGDTRVHFLSPDAALLEGQAEDVAVVNLLIMEAQNCDVDRGSYTSYPNILAFSGQGFVRHLTNCGVAVNTNNSIMGLGELGLLHCHRVIFPLDTGMDPENWTLADLCDQCHRKNGLVVWTRYRLQGWGDCFVEIMDWQGYGEALADLILGKIDALELTAEAVSAQVILQDYYQLLDAGFRLPVVAASGKYANNTMLGEMRTYAHQPTEETITYSGWIEGVRAGRTVVTNGPLLTWTIDGEVPAVNLVLPAEKETLMIRAAVQSWDRFDHLEIVWNGEIVETGAPSARPPYTAELECELLIEASGWLAVRCVTDRLRGKDPLPFAHTTAVRVDKESLPAPSKSKAVRIFLGEIDRMLGKITRNRYAERVRRVLEQARTILSNKLSLSQDAGDAGAGQ
jgi:hypothetical protein